MRFTRFNPSTTLLLLTLSVASLSAQETQRLYLSGHGKDDAVPWRFMCTSGAQSGYWTNLPVPSHWDMQGFGTLSYRRDVTEAYDERGLYERDFTVPAEWSKRRVFLVFDGVMTDTSAKLNGESVGPIHQGGFYRFKYEVTKLVKFGKTNLLEVAVSKHSANRSVNSAERTADYWVFGGIYRPVYLEAEPRQFIERVAIDARAGGSFAVDVYTVGTHTNDYLEVNVFDHAGNRVNEGVIAFVFDGDPGAPPGATRLTMNVPSPREWTAETPYLYRAEVMLKRGEKGRADELLHRLSQRFGFRTMEVRDGDGLYVNGHRVILKGADRHSFWPDSGRCLSEAVHRLDIGTMKDMNMNAVRMSHYPPDAEFLDLCDELGLYVLDELAGWHNKYDTDVGKKLVEEMVVRDVNHPSILFWDNGNEGGFNTNLDTVFGKFDPQQRRVLHPWAPFSGVNTAHYLAYDTARVACGGDAMFYHGGTESVNTNDPKKYIYMPTEFLHGLYDGGAGAGLDDYWRMMSASKTLGGGFIWALTDDAVKRPDNSQMDAAGNQAPDGIVGPYREREASFYAIKEIWSPIQVTRESNNVFAIENHYGFTDANQCRFTLQWRQFPGPIGDETNFVVVEERTLKVASIPPGGKSTVTFDSPRLRERGDALALRVEDPAGRELWTWVWPLAKAGDLSGLVNSPAPQKTSATETTDTIEVKSGDLTVRFSKQTGFLAEVLRGSQKFSLANGPRLETHEPVPAAVPGSAAPRRSTSGTPAASDQATTGARDSIGSTLTNIYFAQDGPDHIVSAKFSGGLTSVLWRVYGNGWVQCDYKFAATGTNDSFGVVFDYPEDYVKSKRWLGDGPFRVWKNRLRGVSFNLWENDYNDTITGYRDWAYPEFKGCFADVRWLQLDTTEGPLTIVPVNVPFVQVLTPEQPPDSLVGQTKVNLLRAGFGFLNGIPAIGTKFKDAKAGGPQGQPNVANGQYSGSVSFYFGELPEK